MRILLKLLALIGIGLAVYTAFKSGELFSSTVISAIFAIVFAVMFLQFPSRRQVSEQSFDSAAITSSNTPYKSVFLSTNSASSGCDSESC
ncbi:hypothetical protein [Thalassomonas actiniarum]|uniref:Uncharacterized protein n=1 Tax=Thalassomonas actiniarum TaxID=485447 RepID=A0AAE9YQZ1_9GAMM|nr:hypothetical protein [Thalassomonas actiniarum]WDD98788.1 hypothetical protein SG35_026765 [Thalassomonas actiniarum]